jgi:protein required for attachment to host cells
MAMTWILVANASSARLFDKGASSKSLNLIGEFSHPESRQKGSELASDRPGHYQSKGTAHGAFTESSNPKELEADRFAQELVNKLEQGRVNNEWQDVIVIAPPHFHGLINKHLPTMIKDKIKSSFSKDYTNLTEKELGAKLAPRG